MRGSGSAAHPFRGPWIPVAPVEVVPSEAGGDTQASSAIDLFLGVGLDHPGTVDYGTSGPRRDAPFAMIAIGVTATRIGIEDGDPIWFLGGAIELKGGLDLERILDPDDDP